MVTVRELKARLSLADTTFTMGMSKAASATKRLQTNLNLAATNIVTFETALKNVDLSNLKQLLATGNKKLAINFSLDWKTMRNDINDFIDAHGKQGNLHAFKDLQLSLDWKYLRNQINEFVENKGAKDKRMKEFNKLQMDAAIGGGSNEILDVLNRMDSKLFSLTTMEIDVSGIRQDLKPYVETLEKAIKDSAPLAVISGVLK